MVIRVGNGALAGVNDMVIRVVNGALAGVNDTLTELDLSWNHIRLLGAIEVAKSLKVLEHKSNAVCYFRNKVFLTRL